MKLKLLVLVPLFATLLFAQSGSDVNFRGGSLSKVGPTLMLPLSSVITFTPPGGPSQSATGVVSLQTGTLASGSLDTGGKFNAGGSIVVQVTGMGTLFNGTMNAEAQWVRTKLANGTFQYTLIALVTDSTSGNTASVVLITKNVGTITTFPDGTEVQDGDFSFN